MSFIKNAIKGTLDVKTDVELVEYLLENSEIDFLSTDNIDSKTIELPNGIVFSFENSGELIEVGIEK